MGQSGEIVINEQVINLTNVTKILWEEKEIKKIDYLNYLSIISDYILPFLKNRLLTTIRFPNGISKEKFYQKNCPDYAPAFIETKQEDNIHFIVCNNLESLMWLGNQSAIEFHIPFSSINQTKPSEIVFDLDPPSRKKFNLAVEAAFLIKEVLDNLKLTSFLKTSGNKGLQIYIPLQDDQYSYQETRLFTTFIAQYLVEKEPKLFTIERLKEKRDGKLYIDYIQHAEGKTIIAPYSARGNKEGLVATPLYWSELSRTLTPEDFHISIIKKRLKKGCPFQEDYFKAKDNQKFQPVLKRLTAST